MKRAVFLDRDGVLVEDLDLLINPADLRILPGVPRALDRLKRAGFSLIVVSNQTVVARGLATESEVDVVNKHVDALLQKAEAPPLTGFYICPHHLNATLPQYRVACQCRKPRPGLILQAAADHGIDLHRSFAVGDRITDIIAGARAGCRTVLVETGKHFDAPIESPDAIDASIKPDHVCANLMAAAEWILKQP